MKSKPAKQKEMHLKTYAVLNVFSREEIYQYLNYKIEEDIDYQEELIENEGGFMRGGAYSYQRAECKKTIAYYKKTIKELKVLQKAMKQVELHHAKAMKLQLG